VPGRVGSIAAGIKFDFKIEAFHIGVGLDDLVRLPHRDIARSSGNAGDAAAVLIKDDAMIGEMIGEGYGCQLADSGQRVFSHHQCG